MIDNTSGFQPPTPFEIQTRESTATDRSVDDVVSLAESDLLDTYQYKRLWESFPASTQRLIMLDAGKIDSEVIMSFKRNLGLVDNVMKRLVSRDGTPMTDAEEYGISLKDAMNLSMRLASTMLKDVPKIYSIERIQRMEQALEDIVERMMNKRQQEAFLEALDEMEQGK